MAGNYLLMMFYTTIGGWMLSYFFKMAKGEFQGLDITGVTQTFDTLRSDAPTMIFWMLMVVVDVYKRQAQYFPSGQSLTKDNPARQNRNHRFQTEYQRGYGRVCAALSDNQMCIRDRTRDGRC